ncbi:hypothetical protein [Cereibacter changlensis]|uniref:hypothetical protein n=1 Tax=Cereibacter changlensis TaxID=402884 RepID=UPI004033969C
MTDREPPAQSPKNVTQDVQAIMDASAKLSSMSCSDCQAAARAPAETDRRNKQAGDEQRETGVFAGLLVMIVLCWIGAGLAIYLI